MKTTVLAQTAKTAQFIAVSESPIQFERPFGWFCAGNASDLSSAASLDSDVDDDLASVPLEFPAASLRHPGGADFLHIINPYSSPPWRQQHAVVRAVEPDLDFFSDSEDEVEMARLEKKYNIVRHLPEQRKPTARSAAALEGVLEVLQCSRWPSADASCHISVHGQRGRM